MPLPVEIIGLNRETITFVWEDDHRSEFRARDIRLACRCALCVDEWTRQPILDPASVPPNLTAKAIEIVGNYGMSVTWSDGHAMGIYHFRDLRERCPCAECAARKP